MISQHNSNWNHARCSVLDWYNCICHEKLKVFFPQSLAGSVNAQILQNSIFRHPVDADFTTAEKISDGIWMSSNWEETDTKGISTWCICQNTKPIWKICPWSNFRSKFEIQQIISLCGCLPGLTGWSLVGRRQDIKCRCDTRLCGIFVKISTFR